MNVTALHEKLELWDNVPNRSRSHPAVPPWFRSSTPVPDTQKGYVLTYEEELHLANDFAFLADYGYWSGTISAATIEQTEDPPCLIIRLISNENPKLYILDGLRKIVEIARQSAKEGMVSPRQIFATVLILIELDVAQPREGFTWRLFDEVVRLSQHTIRQVIGTSGWNNRAYRNSEERRPGLHERLQSWLEQTRVWEFPEYKKMHPFTQQYDIDPLQRSLYELYEILKRSDGREKTKEEHLFLLKAIILKSYEISSQKGSTTLQTYLLESKIPEPIVYYKGAVFEIDTLSKYWQMCQYLIRLSRQPSTRSYFERLKLDICTSTQIPDQPTFHAEVQLALFYEQYYKTLPPRAIGSSRQPCFLCDLFLKHHGRFGMASHEYQGLHQNWTLHDVPRLDSQQRKRIREVVRFMNAEIERLLKYKFKPHEIRSNKLLFRSINLSSTS